jgi:hypothetical protein
MIKKKYQAPVLHKAGKLSSVVAIASKTPM